MGTEIEPVNPLIARIVNMKLYEISDDDICAACGISQSALAQILDSSAYKQMLAQSTVEKFEESQTLNDAWDTIEAQALTNVKDHLEWSKDPDFALKAAMVANKANRRGPKSEHNIPLNAGARAVINLNATFVDKLQQNVVEVKQQVRQLEQRSQDFLDPSKIESLLGLGKDKENSTTNILRTMGVNLLPGE